MGERASDAELQAFIDGQLDVAGRIEVERRLQADPAAAAAVIEGLRLRDELRLFLGEGDWPAPAATVGRARELSRRLAARRGGLRLRRALAAAILVGAGWFAHAELGLFVDPVAASPRVPAYAAEAARSFETLSAHVSGLGLPQRLTAPAAPRTGGEVPLPALLDGSATLLATDLVRWEGGSGLTALYRTHDGRLVSLFAAEAPEFDVTWPRGGVVDGHPTVFWQSGPYAYALSGGMAEADLLELAQRAVPRPWAFFFHPATNDEGAPHG